MSYKKCNKGVLISPTLQFFLKYGENIKYVSDSLYSSRRPCYVLAKRAMRHLLRKVFFIYQLSCFFQKNNEMGNKTRILLKKSSTVLWIPFTWPCWRKGSSIFKDWWPSPSPCSKDKAFIKNFYLPAMGHIFLISNTAVQAICWF